MRKVAIIGQGPGAEYAPKDWERWGLPWAKDYSLDRYFEPHENWETMGAYEDIPSDVLNDCGAPVMLINVHNAVPKSERYPIEAVIEEVGNYLECSISFALAYAILKRIPTIGLYGVSGDDGYSSQRPNIEYLIGYARGLGIAVHVDGASKLLTSEFKAGRYGVGKSEKKV